MSRKDSVNKLHLISWKETIIITVIGTGLRRWRRLDDMILLYVVAVNVVGFALMGIDKSRAKRQAWRIPEKTLFMCAFCGGSFGMIVGMNTFRHKTKHWYFKYGLPAILVVQMVLAGYLLSYR